jgi:phosphoribosylanthranilate isomerase
MKKTQMVVRKRVKGRVEYNDGEFAEIQTVGILGIEENLSLSTIQIHRCETKDSSEEFQQRFEVGMWLDISTVTELNVRRRAK